MNIVGTTSFIPTCPKMTFRFETLDEFARVATVAQEKRLVEDIHAYFPSIRVYVFFGEGKRWREVYWRDQEIKTSDKAKLITRLMAILVPVVLAQRRGMPRLVRFFSEELGWPCCTTQELRDRLLAEAVTR